MEIYSVWRRTKPLTYCGNRLYVYRNCRIEITEDFGKSFFPFAKLARRTASDKMLERFWYYRLMMRRSPVNAITSGRNLIVSCHDSIQTFDESGKIIHIHSLDEGRPQNFASDGDGTVVFGEYFQNMTRSKNVKLFASSDNGVSWNNVVEFPKGKFRHIHKCDYDHANSTWWLATGDFPDESTLLRFTKDFSKVDEPFGSGTWLRSYCLAVRGEFLYFSTDSPNTQNTFSRIHLPTSQVESLGELPNSSFGLSLLKDRIWVSSTAELPDSHAPKCKQNSTRKVFLYSRSIEKNDLRCELEVNVDWIARLLPKSRLRQILFQIPCCLLFPAGNKLLLYFRGTEKWNDSTVVVE